MMNRLLDVIFIVVGRRNAMPRRQQLHPEETVTKTSVLAGDQQVFFCHSARVSGHGFPMCIVFTARLMAALIA
jgi:hypothetical protein